MCEIPLSFFGTWVSEKDDNMDAFLASKGINWLLRKAVLMTTLTIKISDLGGGRYQIEHSVMGKSAKWEFRIGEPYVTAGLENLERTVTPTIEGVTLVERHVYASKILQDDPIRYSVENGVLVQSLSNGAVKCKRYFKRKN